MTKSKEKPGPKPERVKIDEDWEEAIEKALKKKRPKAGWPDHNGESDSNTESEGKSDE